MQLVRRVALDGVYLDDVDSRICISSVEMADAKETINAVDSAARNGQRITAQRRSNVDIVIKFRMLEHGKTVAGEQARAELLEAINAWAALGGYLTTNYKPDRRIYVILAQAPGEGSLWDYTKEFQLTFRAYGIPYWEQGAARTVSFGGTATTGVGSAAVEGSANTQLSVELKNTSGMPITTATITAGGTMTFTGLGLAAGETLVIDHTETGLVRIRIRSSAGVYRSAMAARTASSADDFVAGPGACACSFTAQRACRMTVSWRARYL